jgi:1-acyl-sn-glycerol-3-phosphate acyltransferase
VLRPGLITVSIGPPIDSAGKTAEQLNQEVEGWIESEMRRLSPHLYRSDAHAGATKDPIA